MRLRNWVSCACLALLAIALCSESVLAATPSLTNPNRLYPPSCLPFPLPTVPQGPVLLQGPLPFVSVLDGQQKSVFTRIWRFPCTEQKSAVIMTLHGQLSDVVEMPRFTVAAIENSLPVADWSSIRLATEGNTLGQDVTVAAIEPGVDVSYVFELAAAEVRVPNLNEQFAIVAQLSNGNALFPAFPATILRAYQADPGYQWPAKSPSGFNSGSYFDRSKPGEGLVMQVVELGQLVVVTAYWLTYGANGEGVWLAGASPVSSGQPEVRLELYGYRGGGFAGAFEQTNAPSPVRWGTIDVQFLSCDRVKFRFQSNHGDVRLPIGEGERTWSRFGAINLLACE